jgi:hypothetical protein
VATMMISSEGIPVPRSARNKPRSIVRGKRRSVLIGAIAKLKSLAAQDYAENRRSAIHGYDAYFVLGTQNSNPQRSFVALLARLEEALALKA